MNPVTAVPATMNEGVYGERAGTLTTYPDGSQYFTWSLKRGFSSTRKVN